MIFSNINNSGISYSNNKLIIDTTHENTKIINRLIFRQLQAQGQQGVIDTLISLMGQNQKIQAITDTLNKSISSEMDVLRKESPELFDFDGKFEFSSLFLNKEDFH